MNSDTIMQTFIICMAAMISMLGVVTAIYMLERNRRARYEREKYEYNRVELDSNRRYYEEKIYELQKQLSENERRWKDTNNLVISGQKSNVIEQIKKVDFILKMPFFKNLGISEDNIGVDKHGVFVLTPFIEEERATYKIIKEICNDVGLNCSRGDEKYRDKDILSHTILDIVNSRVVIANINGRNPNVFYELGICHTIGKPVIIISSVKEKIPFDVMTKNIVLYHDIGDLRIQLRDELLKIFINNDED